ncbi:MAG TPA: hypothetical protein VGE59_00480, partial [Patescibacteria group bacterium]
MKRPWFTVVWLVIITMIAVAIVKPHGELNFYKFRKQFSFSEGLDLQGGVHLKYILDLSEVAPQDREQATQGVKNVIENRINPLGIAEPVVQTAKVGNDAALIIELPGQKDPEAAKDLIGKTAKLTFRESDEAGENFIETNLTGAD